jgi:TPR repeat protein
MRIAVAAALLFPLLAGPALAQSPPVKAPKAAKPAVQQAPAKPSLFQLATQGDAQAQYLLGVAHRDGKGAKKDFDEAASWFAMAAGNGIAPAAIELARAYEQGAGGRRDLGQAARWWYRAGELGEATARARFLAMLLAGETAGFAGPATVEWLEPTAREGDVRSILGLGDIYEKGLGLPADVDKARAWYLQAAFAGNAEAKFRLGRMLLAQPSAWRLIFKDFDREKTNAERDRLFASREAAQEAAGSDRFVDIVRPHMVEGERWLTEAAHQGHAEAQYVLGLARLAGMDLPFDLIDGLGWLSAAAWGGHPGAMMAVADLAAKGQGFFAKDPVRAWVNYDAAAAMGYRPAEEARDRVGKALNPRQLARAQRLAADLRGN